jgi:hypothetical protein
MILTLVTVAISKVHLPRPQAIALGLFVASIKASLVGAIFMHLWGEKKLILNFLLITVACGIMMIIPLIDFHLILPKVTQRMSVADQHPEESSHHESIHSTVVLPPHGK